MSSSLLLLLLLSYPAGYHLQLWEDPFLPTSLFPVSYTISFFPDFYFDGSVFYGNETIEIFVQQATTYIILHHKMMNITATTLYDNNDTVVPLVQTFSHEPNEYWVIETSVMLLSNATYFLSLSFQGLLTNGIVGYYKSTYVHDVTGVQSWLATTKFQPSDARKAFPNFDEPRFKSFYEITLTHWKNFTALSNMPVQSQTSLDTVWQQTTFTRSPLMSSYLVCFIVCDFNFQENQLNDGKTHRVWSRPDRLNQTSLALDVSPIMADYYVEEFNYPYPLPKLDQFGVPDYPSGATEHWGLITYRDTRLLYDATQVGDYDRQGTISIIAHELSHNHLGNLYTCQNWGELWLNEGFARFYQTKAVVEVAPELYYNGTFYTRTLQPVMNVDSTNSSRALVVTIATPNEANAMFDAITYSKGAAILNMMEGFLGYDQFRLSIQRFIADNTYDTVVTDDLWTACQQIVGNALNISEVMSTWVYSMGYPVIDLTRPEPDLINAAQSRYLIDPSMDPESPATPTGYKWYVPLTYRTKSGKKKLIWMEKINIAFRDSDISDDEWIKFNPDYTGYYRVNYPSEMWTAFSQQLQTNHQALSDIERASLLNDAFTLARSSHTTYDNALDLTLYLTSESDLLPWDSTEQVFDYITNMLFGFDNYPLWQKHILELTTPLMNSLKVVDQGTYLEKLNRRNLMILACSNGHVTCKANTTKLFNDWITDSQLYPVPINLKRQTYSIGIENSDSDEDWNTVWQRYQVATSGQEQDNLLFALCSTVKLHLIDQLLDYSMDESKIRSQDFFTLISYAASNLHVNSHVWNWVKDNYSAIVARFGLSNRSLGRMVPGIVQYFNTAEELSEVQAFFAANPDPGTGARFREEALQNINANINWMNRSYNTITDWLENNQSAGSLAHNNHSVRLMLLFNLVAFIYLHNC